MERYGRVNGGSTVSRKMSLFEEKNVYKERNGQTLAVAFGRGGGGLNPESAMFPTPSVKIYQYSRSFLCNMMHNNRFYHAHPFYSLFQANPPRGLPNSKGVIT